MSIPSNRLACQALFFQAADEGRGPVLFGDGRERACEAVLPMVEGVPFPKLYLEFPLAGEPFLDVTVLYGEIKPGTRFESDAAAGSEAMLDWYAEAYRQHPDICCGFELDTRHPEPGPAAVHLQTFEKYELAEPFCEAVGSPRAGRLYTEQAAKMPAGWPLAFFGLFRGRTDAPLRVCGYLDNDEIQRCAQDPARIEEVFRKTGFTAYDSGMLSRISALLAAAPGTVDFQFDLLPDGTPGDMFALDISLGVQQAEKVRASFRDGADGKIMGILEDWGIADGRQVLIAGMSFTRSIPVRDGEGNLRRYALVLNPVWVKVRWRGGKIQPAKMYCMAHAGLMEEKEEKDGIAGE